MSKNNVSNQGFSKIEQNLHLIFQAWEKLGDEQKKRKINFILPFVQLTSYLESIRQMGILPELQRGNFDVHLESFRQDYARLFDGHDLSKMQSSDISPELFRKIEKAQNDNQPLTLKDREALLSYGDKYVHAHNRIMFNYGSFLLEIFKKNSSVDFDDKITEFNKNEFSDESQEKKRRKELAGKADNPEARLFIYLNSLFELEQNSALIEKDDLENHALLNQMSNYSQHFLLFNALSDDNKKKQIIETINSVDNPSKSAIKRNNNSQEIHKNFEESLKDKGMSVQVGIETEFLLHESESNDLKTPVQRNVALKKILADLNARRKMQTKYGLEPTVPEIKDLTIFLENIEVDETKGAKGMVIDIKDFLEITQDIDKNLNNSKKEYNEEYNKEEMLSHVANFTKAEAFFYKFLLLNGDFTQRNRVEIDGVYDPKKEERENFHSIWNLIKQGSFHEKALDMIQAHEIAFGPHAISEIIPVKMQVLENMKTIAQDSGLSVDDPNVQINLSFWIDHEGEPKNILIPEIIKTKDKTIVQISTLGVEFLKIVEEVVAEAAREVEGIVRAQEVVNSGLDKKKHIGSKLQKTEYLDVNSELPAFLNHKRLAAKNVNIRVSAINDEVAVAEIRLIGNNPHFAQFDNSETENVYRSGLEFIPEVLLPKVAERIMKFVGLKTEKQLQILYSEKVLIDKNGKIAGLDVVKIEDAQHDNIFDSAKREEYNPIPKPIVREAVSEQLEESKGASLTQ